MTTRQLYLILVALYHTAGRTTLEEAKQRALAILDMDTPFLGDE